VIKPIEWLAGDVDHFGNAALDDAPDSDHNGKAEHKGSWESAAPRVRYWRPQASELLCVATNQLIPTLCN